MFAALIVGAVWKLGAPEPPVAGPAKTLFCAAPDAVPVPPFAIGSVPLTSAVSDTAELVTVCVDPAKWAMPTPGDAARTQVEQ